MSFRDRLVTKTLLRQRIGSGKFGVSRWIKFCQYNMGKEREVYLYECSYTVSKYVTVRGPFDLTFKVRFSNHKPITRRVLNKDCDFFVGVTDFGALTIDDAIRALEEYFDVTKSVGEKYRETCRKVREEARY